MFEKLVAPDNVIAIHLSDTLTVDDVKHYKVLIEDKIAEHERFGMCVDLTGLDKIGADALTEDAKVEFGLLTHLKKFRRCAIVTDASWLRTLANTFGHLIPVLEMKSFEGGERAAAIAWAANGPAREETKSAPVVGAAPDDMIVNRRVGA
jgi:hypothetical protein